MYKRSKHVMSEQATEIADSLRLGGNPRLLDFVNEGHRRGMQLNREDVLGLIDRSPSMHQYYTSDDVAKFMARIGMHSQPRLVLDPACGVGNLLHFCSAAEYVSGIDVSNDLTPIASILCPRADLRHSDFLNSDRDRLFDLVIMDPPWGLADRSSKKPFEQRMVEKALECLAPNGMLVALVPPSLLWSEPAATLREAVLKHYSLEAVVSLWPGALRETIVGSAVLVIRKRPPGSRVFVAVAGGADDLPRLAAELEEGNQSRTIDVRMFSESWNPARLLLRRAESEGSIRYEELAKLAEVLPGASVPKQKRRQHGDFLVFSPRHLRDVHLVPETGGAEYVDAEDVQGHEQCIAAPGDIVMCLRFTPGKTYIIRKDDPPCIIPSGFAIIRSDLSSYIRSFLSTAEHRDLILDKARAYTRGGVIESLSLADVQRMRIPILPLGDPSELDPERLRKKSPDEQADLLNRLVAIDRNNAKRTMSPRYDSCVRECSPEEFHSVDKRTAEPPPPYVTHDEDEGLHRQLASLAELVVTAISEVRVHNERVDRALDQIIHNFGPLLDGQQALGDSLIHIRRDVGAIRAEVFRIAEFLQTSFAEVKNAHLEDDRKVESLFQLLDQVAATVHDAGTDLSPYRESASSLIPRWDWMEEASQAALVMAEYLLRTFQTIAGVDYSPCVLEYSKSLENELLVKVFMRFVESLKTPASSSDLHEGLDAEVKDRGDSMKFARAVRSCLFDDGKLRLSLGEMLYELQYARTHVDSETSLTRRRFVQYLRSQMVTTQTLSQSSLKMLERFRDNYRNLCAHPAWLDRTTAVSCREEVPVDMEWVLSTIKPGALSGT